LLLCFLWQFVSDTGHLTTNAPVHGASTLQMVGLNFFEVFSVPATGPPSTIYRHSPSHWVGLTEELSLSTVEPSYNNISLYSTSLIELDILWYQLICQC
jgi:hypothetical protein